MVFYKINYKQYGNGAGASIIQITSDDAVDAFLIIQEIFELTNWEITRFVPFIFNFFDNNITFYKTDELLNFLIDKIFIINSYLKNNQNIDTDRYNLKESFVKFQNNLLSLLKEKKLISSNRESIQEESITKYYGIINYIWWPMFIFSQDPNDTKENMKLKHNSGSINDMIRMIENELTIIGHVEAQVVKPSIATPTNNNDENLPEASRV